MLYRYVSFLALKHNPKNLNSFIKKKFEKLNYKKLNKINLQTQKITAHSAKIAKIAKIRDILKNFQIKFSKKIKTVALKEETSLQRFFQNQM